MNLNRDLKSLLNADEQGIAVFSGKDLNNIQDFSGGFAKPYSVNNGHPLPEIINVLGERSSKVIKLLHYSTLIYVIRGILYIY